MTRIWKLAVFITAVCTSSVAQQNATVHAPDGGTRETIQSIAILPLMNAPFSAVVVTEWNKLLPDGTQATVKNHRTVARDSAGRIFEERRSFSVSGDTEETLLWRTEYTDPSRHEFYSCDTRTRTCTVSTYPITALMQMPAGMSGINLCNCASPHLQGWSVQQEALGQKTIEDVDAIGSREITTLPAGEFGNPRNEPIVKEFWYSPRLGINLVTKRFDPRSGSQNFFVERLSLTEPDPKTFEPPADYRVVRQVVVKQGSTDPN